MLMVLLAGLLWLAAIPVSIVASTVADALGLAVLIGMSGAGLLCVHLAFEDPRL